MGYRLLDPRTHKMTVSKNVTFNERKKISICEQEVPEDIFFEPSKAVDSTEKPEEIVDMPKLPDKPTTSLQRPKRKVQPPKKLQDYEVYQAMVATEDILSYEEFENLPTQEQEMWREAMKDEMEAMKKNEVWDLVKLPRGRNVVSCKWILKKKKRWKIESSPSSQRILSERGN